MNKGIGVALIIVGALLIYWGYNASESLSSQLSEAVTGNPTDETLWYYAGGAASLIVGAFLLFKK